MALSDKPAWEAFLYQPASWLEPLRWNRVFPLELPVHIDWGAGDGGFIRACARRNPKVNFLGVERLLGRVRKIAKAAFREGLTNLRGLRIEGAYALEYLIPPRSVAAMTILFPDPWPKRRHQKNRLIQTPLLEHCARALQPDGWLAIKTDDYPYFQHIQEALSKCHSLEKWENVSSDALVPEVTDFEKDFLKENRPIHFIAARPKK